jgi:murein DD-endopeptidase MepM/ murein hydrolase activator NlpD
MNMEEIRRREQSTSKRLSFIVLNSNGKQVKKFNASLVFLSLLIISIASGLSLLGFFLYNYHSMQASMATISQMAQKVVAQHEEITQQRLQIQTFADEINTLQDKLIRLSQFEEKIRLLANLEPPEDQANPSGVGGATPESLDSKLELNASHERLIREMHRQIDDLEMATIQQSESFDSLIDKLEYQRSLLAATPSIRPTTGWMSSRFGRRISPFTGRKEFHKGVDIANRKGTDILATADGVVTFVGKKKNMGNVVVIDHGHGMLTRYAHLSDALKHRGDKVKRGDIVAHMGSTGRSTGPHLHYEVHLNGIPVNPEKYILN